MHSHNFSCQKSKNKIPACLSFKDVFSSKFQINQFKYHHADITIAIPSSILFKLPHTPTLILLKLKRYIFSITGLPRPTIETMTA